MKYPTFKMYVTQREALEDPLSVLDQESWFTFARSGGPGGQNVNKVSSKAILWWSVAHSKVWNGDVDALARFSQMFKNKINKEGLLVLACQDQRDQLANKMECMNKLKMMVRQALVPPTIRTGTQPTLGGNERRIADKKADQKTKERRRFTPDFE